MKRLFLALSFVLVALPVGAQTLVNPVRVEFTPSADHAGTSIDGTPLVVKYEMRVFLEGGTTVLFVTDLGKPTPTLNLISVTNAVWFSGLTPNTKYIAKVAAIGSSGEGVSDASNAFGNVPPPMKPTAVTVKR